MCRTATALEAPGSFAAATTASSRAAIKTLLAACAVGSRGSAGTVVAEGAVAFISAGLLAISTLRLPLIFGTREVLIVRAAILLIEVRLRSSALLRQVSLRACEALVICGAVLLIEVWLRTTALLRKVAGILVPELSLIAVLIEVGLGEVIRPIIAIDVVCVQVVSVDVVGIDIVAIDVVGVDVIAVVVVVPVYKRIRVGDVSVVVVDDG